MSSGAFSTTLRSTKNYTVSKCFWYRFILIRILSSAKSELFTVLVKLYNHNKALKSKKLFAVIKTWANSNAKHVSWIKVKLNSKFTALLQNVKYTIHLYDNSFVIQNYTVLMTVPLKAADEIENYKRSSTQGPRLGCTTKTNHLFC